MQKYLEKITNPAIFIFIAAILRLIPHVPNFAPIGAMALFGGTYLDRRLALILPIAAMVLSDFFIGFDNIESRLTVYGSFILIGLIGFWLRNHKSPGNVFLASFLGSVIFFVITNFGVWLFAGLYPKTWTGLVECYTLAIPFFRNTLLGDFFYTGIFFGGYELARSLVTKKTKATAVVRS